jgi:hypothetical protein
MVTWVKGHSTRSELMEQSFQAALNDAVTMKHMGDEASGAKLDMTYDVSLKDVENALETFIRIYLDPEDLHDDEPAVTLDPEGTASGAFFIGFLTGWRYRHYNDHSFNDED